MGRSVTKNDWSLLLVLLAAIPAWYAATRFVARSKRLNTRPERALSVVTEEDVPAPTDAPALPARALTARERRHEEIRTLASGDRCLYCAQEAQRPFPFAAFSAPNWDVHALATGDLPRHWRVREPVSDDVAWVLCVAHHTLARTAVELRAAQAHADYVAFVASQKESLVEFTLHGLDESLRAEAERVRRGRNGAAT